MIHPSTELRWISKEKGYGVFATGFIAKGTMTYVPDDLDIRIDPDNALLLDARYASIVEKYSFVDCNGTKIVSWDHAKFVNHCCDPNTLTTGWGFEIAIKDIEKDEEITDDYGIFTFEHLMYINCEKTGCRGKICITDFDANVSKWDKNIKSALANYLNVDQPLDPFLDDVERRSLSGFLNAGRGFKSVRGQKPTLKPAVCVAK